MKKNIFYLILLCFTINSFSTQELYAANNIIQQNNDIKTENYSGLWNRIDSLEEKGLSRSALELSGEIFKKAQAENNPAQLVKAMIHRLKFQNYLEEDGLIKNIRDLENETKQAKGPESLILHSMLAEIYWNYYQQNRYRFMGRSETKEIQSDDPATWDLHKIIQACLSHYTASLTQSEQSKNTTLEIFDEIISKDDTSDTRKFRPTLYDFLAHRALDFYSNTESGLTAPAEKFNVDRPEYLGSAEEFIKLNISSTDASNFTYMACKLFQEVLAFHISDKDPIAFIDADLKRQNFIYSAMHLITKDSLYENSLNILAEKYKSHPMSTEAISELAGHFETKGNLYNALESEKHKWELQKALNRCNQAIKQFPDSRGAKRCVAIKERLLFPAVSFFTEEVSPMGRASRLLLEYRNLDKVYIRLFKDKSDSTLIREQAGELLIRAVKSMDLLKSWSVELPADTDLQRHTVEISVPALDFGKYILVISDEEQLDFEKNIFAYSYFRISEMSLLSRNISDGSYEFFVLDRSSGEPIKDVSAEITTQTYNRLDNSYESSLIANYRSDAKGRFEVSTAPDGRRNFNVKLKKNDDILYLKESFYQYGSRPGNRQKVERTIIFTDRSIYRPGQLIYFKALLLDVIDGNPTILVEQNTTIQFFDVNGQLISEQKLRSNKFGTVQGSFTAPQGMLNGQMRIQNNSGATSVSIEEYKRPKFEVVFKPVSGSYRLGAEIKVEGIAKTYSGVSVDAAKVNFRVSRVANFPPWCYWYRGMFPQSPAQEILSGETTTDADGNFIIAFTAIPDENISSKFQPIFNFEVTADVTDVNGETRSANTIIRAAHTSIELSTDFPESFDLHIKKEYKVLAKNLSDNPEPTMVRLKIYRIKEPDRLLRSREWARPDKKLYTKEEYIKLFPLDVYDQEDDFLQWEKQEVLWSTEMNTGTDSIIKFDSNNLLPGFYLLEGNTLDAFGAEVKLIQYFSAFDITSNKPTRNAVEWMKVLKDDAAPGQSDKILLSTAAKNVFVLVQIELHNEIISKEWIRLSNEQKILEFPVKEEYRGNFSVYLNFVKNGRVYSESILMKVPWDTKELSLEYETFRSKLEPGKKEEWKIKIKDNKGASVKAELLASMYDASLDVFKRHSWNRSFYNTYGNYLRINSHLVGLVYSDYFSKRYLIGDISGSRIYERLNWFDYSPGGFYPSYRGARSEVMTMYSLDGSASGSGEVLEKGAAATMYKNEDSPSNTPVPLQDPMKPAKNPETSSIQFRKNLQETAFFYPQIYSSEDSSFTISFTSPEALTRWKLQLFAHTNDMKYAFAEKEVITQKELMIVPNLPRFLRAGDSISISSKINSLVDGIQKGTASMHILDAFTMKEIDSLFRNTQSEKTFTVGKDKSENASWSIIVPENISAVVIRITAKTGNYSDGEENILPVLTNRQLVTESMPFWTRGNETKKFEMKKLIDNSSKTLTHRQLKLEYTSNPVWTVVQALPYLMEYPQQCSEQIFSRYYANTIASHIANSTPRIKEIFNTWKALSPESFLSNLEKNQDLKSVVLAETPWVLDAKGEQEQKERIALLFDLNRMANEQNDALNRLQKQQMANGAWPWFDGMPDNRYITQYIVSGFLQLRELGVLSESEILKTDLMIKRAIPYLDQEIIDDYHKIKEENKSTYIPSPLQLQYLYLRSFSSMKNVDNQARKQHDYFLDQAGKYWLKGNEFLQAMNSLAQFRNGKKEVSTDIINSLKDNAIHSEEFGMYWKNINGGYFWTEAAVETQSMLIEAFNEITQDKSSVEEMKIWLLRQKQTHNWKSTKATVAACYALLLRGNNWVEKENVLRISIGDKVFQTNDKGLNQEAGTGNFSITWNGSAVKPNMGKIEVGPATKMNDTLQEKTSVSWGALYWQYFENLDKISGAETKAISLKKNLFIQRNASAGPVIEKIDSSGQVKTGDRIIVRIELRTDRAMEYLHLKEPESFRLGAGKCSFQI